MNLSALPLNEKCIQIINNQETVDKLNDEYLQLIDTLSIYDADKPKFVVTDLVATDLLDAEWKRAQVSKNFDEELEPSLNRLPLCTLCDTEFIDGKEVPVDKVLTSDLDFGMRLLFDYALVLDPRAKVHKTLKVEEGST